MTAIKGKKDFAHTLAEIVFGDKDWTIDDSDNGRLYMTRDNEEYTIRMWNITNRHCTWTLFKHIDDGDGTGHGEDLKRGVFKFNCKDFI